MYVPAADAVSVTCVLPSPAPRLLLPGPGKVFAGGFSENKLILLETSKTVQSCFYLIKFKIIIAFYFNSFVNVIIVIQIITFISPLSPASLLSLALSLSPLWFIHPLNLHPSYYNHQHHHNRFHPRSQSMSTLSLLLPSLAP